MEQLVVSEKKSINFKFTTLQPLARRFCGDTTKLLHTPVKTYWPGFSPSALPSSFHLAHWSSAIPNANSAHEIIIVLQMDASMLGAEDSGEGFRWTSSRASI